MLLLCTTPSSWYCLILLPVIYSFYRPCQAEYKRKEIFMQKINAELAAHNIAIAFVQQYSKLLNTTSDFDLDRSAFLSEG